MRNYVFILSLLLSVWIYGYWNYFFSYSAQDSYLYRTVAGEDFSIMALRYSACNLQTLNRNYPLSSDTYELCRNVGILRRTRSDRVSRRWFTRSSADAVRVPIFHRKSRSLLSSGVDLKKKIISTQPGRMPFIFFAPASGESGASQRAICKQQGHVAIGYYH